MQYRFPHYKGRPWNTYEKHQRRYSFIEKFLDDGMVGAELGVHGGGFGEFLLQHCSVLYLVDPWDQDDHTIWYKPEYAQQKFEAVSAVYDSEPNVHIIRERAEDFLATTDVVFDFLYLDTSHTFRDTMVELHVGMKRIRPGGYYLGDDWHKSHPGVINGVTQFCKGHNLEVELLDANQWAIQKPFE